MLSPRTAAIDKAKNRMEVTARDFIYLGGVNIRTYDFQIQVRPVTEVRRFAAPRTWAEKPAPLS